MQQAGKENENMPGAIEHSRPVRHTVKVMEILVHVLAGEKKDDHGYKTENCVELLHRRRSLGVLALQ